MGVGRPLMRWCALAVLSKVAPISWSTQVKASRRRCSASWPCWCPNVLAEPAFPSGGGVDADVKVSRIRVVGAAEIHGAVEVGHTVYRLHTPRKSRLVGVGQNSNTRCWGLCPNYS